MHTFIVAVSQRIDDYPERAERRDALDQRLIEFLLVAGLTPVPVPNGLCHPAVGANETHLGIWLKALAPQAIVLSGGNDLGACPDRDATENTLLDYAHAQDLPLLGICRGMQMLAVWSGGRLMSVDHHVRTRHCLQEIEAGRSWPETVNSYHNQSLQSCPPDFVVTARAEDGNIEAIRHQNRRWEGWMWHPEREQTFSAIDQRRVKELFFGQGFE